MALVKPLAVMAIVPRNPTRVTEIARPIPTRVTGIMARTTIPATAIDRRMAITMAMVIITDEAERRDAIIAPSSSIARVRGCQSFLYSSPGQTRLLSCGPGEKSFTHFDAICFP